MGRIAAASGTRAYAAFLPLLCPNHQPLLAVDPVNPLRIHWPALALEHDRKPPVSEAQADGGQFAEAMTQRLLWISERVNKSETQFGIV